MFNILKKKLQGEKVVLKIDGMHCTSCAMNIDGELEELDGVIEATTSYAKANTQVVYDPNKVNKKQLFRAVNKAGYEVIEN